jgi:hypothetical protein
MYKKYSSRFYKSTRRYREDNTDIPNKVSQQPEIIIFSEDSISFPSYFQCFIKEHRLHKIIFKDSSSSPSSILKSADKEYESYLKNFMIKYPHLTLAEVTDEFAKELPYIFCVFDRDRHADYKKTIKLYQELCEFKPVFKDKIKLFTSDPCFEFWLILHFQYTSASYEHFTGSKSIADKTISELNQVLKQANFRLRYSKDSSNLQSLYQLTKHRLGEAIKNAKKLEKENQLDQKTSPRTDLYKLYEFIINKYHLKIN